MIIRSEYKRLQQIAAEMIRNAGIFITSEEEDKIAVADFGLGRIEKEGAQILTYFSTDRISAKVIVLLPGQTLPEHWHPPVGDDPGKEEKYAQFGAICVFIFRERAQFRKVLYPREKKRFIPCEMR